MVIGLAPSTHRQNVYFLFTELCEKTILTDDEKRIKNLHDFTIEERNYLQSNKFKIY